MNCFLPSHFWKQIYCLVLLCSIVNSGVYLAQDKDTINKLLEQAEDLFKQGKYKNALAFYDQVIQADAENLAAYYRRAEANFFLQDYAAAIADATLSLIHI